MERPWEDNVLVGRQRELAGFERALEAAERGPVAVAVSGEPGIGKTRLLAELHRRADGRGALVLDGRGSEAERGIPFGPLIDAVDDYLASLNGRYLEDLGAPALGELARVFPALASVTPAAEGTEEQRHRLQHAVRSLLESLAGRRTVVLTLDDLHWADDATLDLVSYLLRRPPRAAVALVLAFRSTDVPENLRSALTQAKRTDLLSSFAPQPLSAAEAEELLGARFDEQIRIRLYRESGGNPFYLEELARAEEMRGGRPAGSLITTPRDVPATVAEALTCEINALSEQARRLLAGAAVVGETFETELAAVAADIDRGEAYAGLDELVERSLVRATDVPQRFRFRHAIIRNAVYASSGAGWRIGSHGRVAQALAERGAPAIARAVHVQAAALPGDDDAVAVLTDAGRSAAPRAPAAAAHWYEAALRLLTDADPRRVALLVPMAQALGFAGRFEESREALEEVLSLLPADAHSLRARVVAGCARIDQALGRHGQARADLTKALEALPDGSSPEAADLEVMLAAEAFFTGDFDGLRRWSEQARAGVGRESVGTQAATIALLGCAEYMVDDVAAAWRLLDEAEELFGRLSEEELARRLSSLSWAGICETFLGRNQRALDLLESGLTAARATGHGHVSSLLRFGQGLALIWLGRLAEAQERLEPAVEAALLTGNRQFLCWNLWATSWANLASGDLTAAIRLGEQAVEAATDDPVSAMAGCFLAEARLEAGEAARCREELLAAAGGPGLPVIERAFRSRWYEVLTRAELASDRLDAATGWAAQAEAAVAGIPIAGRRAEALRARAAVALAAGQAKAAADLALAAAADATSGSLPIEAGRALTLAGTALAAAGHVERAAAELDSARNRLQALGAHRYSDAAASELRRLGRRVPRAGVRRAVGEGVNALSAREREIAELTAAGRTNREMAAALFLSPKTVENHMSRIFAKLGASSRAEVAAMVTRDHQRADETPDGSTARS